MEQLGLHWTDFHKILYLSIIRKSVEEIQVSLKSDKNNGYFTRRPMYIFDRISLSSTYNEKQAKVVEKVKIHIWCSMTFFFENRAVYQITWKNIVQPDRPQITIWHMHIACWIRKATNTHSQYVLLTAFPLQQWLPERASVLRYTFIASLVSSYNPSFYCSPSCTLSRLSLFCIHCPKA
jgi:hypothetical protein